MAEVRSTFFRQVYLDVPWPVHDLSFSLLQDGIEPFPPMITLFPADVRGGYIGKESVCTARYVYVTHSVRVRLRGDPPAGPSVFSLRVTVVDGH